MSTAKEVGSSPLWGIIDDPWRKLAAALMATLFWFWLDSQVTTKVTFPMRVDFNQKNKPGNRIEVMLPTNDYRLQAMVDGDTGNPLENGLVMLTLQGPNHVMKSVRDQLVYQVQLTRDAVMNVENGASFISIRLEDLHHRRGTPEFDHLRDSMSPRTVKIVLERNDQKVIALARGNVELDLGGDPKKLASRVANVTFFPAGVTMFGPVEQLEKIKPETRLFRLKINPGDVGADGKVRKPLTLRQEFVDKGIEIARRSTPTVTYEFQPDWVRYTLVDVPVRLDWLQADDADARRCFADPPTMTIQIGAAGNLNSDMHIDTNGPENEAKAEWCLQHARLRVYLTSENLADLTSNGIIEVRPNLHLFKFELEKLQRYRNGVDYQLERLPLIKIKLEQ